MIIMIMMMIMIIIIIIIIIPITTTKHKKNLLFTPPRIILATCHLAVELAQGHCTDTPRRDAQVASLCQGSSGICLLASLMIDLRTHFYDFSKRGTKKKL